MKKNSLAGTLNHTFGTKFTLAVILIGCLSISLHLGWTVHKRSLLASRIREAAAQVLGDSIQLHDLRTAKQIIKSFAVANPEAQICVRLSDHIALTSSQCSASDYVSYKTPLSDESFYVGVRLNPVDIMTGIGFLLLVPLLALLIIVNATLKRFSAKLLEDIRSLGQQNKEAMTFSELQDAKAQIEKVVSLERENQSMKATALIGELMREVEHDIRSPLTTLEVLLQSMKGIEEEKRLSVRRSLNSIRDILNTLREKSVFVKERLSSNAVLPAAVLERSLNRQDGCSLQLLFGIAESQVVQSRIQHGDKTGVEMTMESDASSYGLFGSVNASSLKRVLSNLINNSIEAIESEGSIAIDMFSRDGFSVIRVRDNGKGIPEHVLPKIAQRNFSNEKETGLGLGLSQAKATLESWGGKLEVFSALGNGTTVELHIPLAKPAAWFVSELKLRKDTAVVIVDDDASVYELWKHRLRADQTGPCSSQIIYHSSIKEFEAWHHKNAQIQDVLYLVDYELRHDVENGLDLIRRLRIQSKAVLVTNVYDEGAIQSQCISLGVRLIPKCLINLVPVVGEKSLRQFSSIYINDDLSQHHLLEGSKYYLSMEDFLEEAPHLDRSIPIYVNDRFSDGLAGDSVAKIIAATGFKDVQVNSGDKQWLQ